MSGLVSLSTSPKALYVYWVATSLGSVSCVSWSSAFQAWVAAVLSAKVVAVLRLELYTSEGPLTAIISGGLSSGN